MNSFQNLSAEQQQVIDSTINEIHWQVGILSDIQKEQMQEILTELVLSWQPLPPKNMITMSPGATGTVPAMTSYIVSFDSSNTGSNDLPPYFDEGTPCLR